MTEVLRTLSAQLQRALAQLSTWFEPPLEADARPLEIREAVIDRVEQRVEPAAAGRRVLPHNHVSITVVAGDKDDRAALEAALDDVADAIRARLAEIRCPLPSGFDVEVHYLEKAKSGWKPEQRFAVDFESRVVTRPTTTRASSPPALRMNVLRGQASEPCYTLKELHVRIGRTAAPLDHTGRPRHNHVIFVEEGDEHSATVGRAHASIRYDAARREYRLFDDGSHNGTRVVRSGTILNVVARDPVGVTILSGDEVQLGTAALLVEIDPAQEPREISQAAGDPQWTTSPSRTSSAGSR
jgi:hypothetical protein